jgi:predicted O-methyltransferase YrrM
MDYALYRRHRRMREATGGLLPAKVYAELTRVGQRMVDLPVIEVGSFSGASTIALAWGMSGKRSNIVAVEKCEGGQWVSGGKRYESNLERLERNLREFGVADRVVLFPHYLDLETGPKVHELAGNGPLAALCHDADGRIDRDFALFWEHLVDDAPIVIDDYRTAILYEDPNDRHPKGRIKGQVTYRMVNQMVAWGLLQIDRKIKDTLFGHKPPGADFGVFDAEHCEAIYQSVLDDRDAFLGR